MYTISCFADEIAPDLETQIRVMKKLGVRYLSLRAVDDVNVLKLSDQQLDRIAEMLSENGIGVSSIGSPVGKSPIRDETGLHLKQTARAIEIAKRLGCSKIRVFSFYMEPTELDDWRDEVIRRLREMAQLAAEAGVELVLENEAGIYGQASERSRDVLEQVNMPSLRAAFDPSNYVVAGEKPFTESFPRVADYVDYLHIKDSRSSDGMITRAGTGDGEIPQILEALQHKDLFLTLEPHLMVAGRNQGFTGEELFAQAHAALVRILDDKKLKYN